MRNGRFLPKCWKSTVLPVMHAVKFGKENLWTYILSRLIIWEYLESKDILDETYKKERGQDRRGPYHEELLRNVSMKYYIFLIFFLNKYYE